MLFNSLTFVAFFAVVLTACWSMRSWNARKNLLVVASYIFDGAWNPPFAALLKQEELTLDDLLKRLPIPNRPGALVRLCVPPYFGTLDLDRERRARMIEECARPGKLQSTIQRIWLPLFTPPPPPTYIPKEEFGKQMGQAIEQHFHDVATAM